MPGALMTMMDDDAAAAEPSMPEHLMMSLEPKESPLARALRMHAEPRERPLAPEEEMPLAGAMPAEMPAQGMPAEMPLAGAMPMFGFDPKAMPVLGVEPGELPTPEGPEAMEMPMMPMMPMMPPLAHEAAMPGPGFVIVEEERVAPAHVRHVDPGAPVEDDKHKRDIKDAIKNLLSEMQEVQDNMGQKALEDIIHDFFAKKSAASASKSHKATAAPLNSSGGVADLKAHPSNATAPKPAHEMAAQLSNATAPAAAQREAETQQPKASLLDNSQARPREPLPHAADEANRVWTDHNGVTFERQCDGRRCLTRVLRKIR